MSLIRIRKKKLHSLDSQQRNEKDPDLSVIILLTNLDPGGPKSTVTEWNGFPDLFGYLKMVSSYQRYRKLLCIVLRFTENLLVKFVWDFQDDFFKFYSDESDGLSLEDTDDASESETYHNRLAMSID
jgi:hypothetical protein